MGICCKSNTLGFVMATTLVDGLGWFVVKMEMQMA
ncbi:hypothetical protein BH10ACI2_BH10ACI2_03630 [soil metagenome]